MALRNILTDEDPILRKKSRVVTNFDARLHTLIDDMRETLSNSGGVGLAAPQVGILRRVVLVEDDDANILELVNPEILETAGEQDGLEGCLSMPGQWGQVKRPNYVKIKAQDRFGNWYEAEGYELTARAFCHETDHLEGILYKDVAYHMLTQEELDEMCSEQEEDEEV